MGHGRGIYIWNRVRKLGRFVAGRAIDKVIPGLGNRRWLPKWEHEKPETLQVPLAQHGDVVGKVSGDDLGQGAHGEAIVTGDAASRPRRGNV